MAINPPEGIADFLAFVSGMEWPEADEDLMRRVSEHYGAIARDLETLSGYVVELIPIVKNDFDGEAADSFLLAMNDLTGQTAGANQLEQTAELSRQLSEVALKVANQVEYTKIMAILQLVQLLAEILFATLFSAFTFGSVWGPVSALFAATREGLHQLFRWLLQTIISQTFIGIVGGVFQDTVIQLYQLGAGHTTSWNTESLIDSIKQGALSGVVAGPLEILSHYGGKLLGRLLGGRAPGSILSKRVDDVLNKVDDKLDDITPNPKPDVPTGGAGAAGSKSKLDDLASKTDKDLPSTRPNRTPNEVTSPPVPPKTVGDGVVPPPATGRPKPEAPGGATAKDRPNAPATGTKGAPAPAKGNTPPGTRSDVPAPNKADVPAPNKADVPTTGTGDVPAPHRTDVPTASKGDGPPTSRTDTHSTDGADAPNAHRTETVGGNEAPGAGKTAAGDAPKAEATAGTPDASTAGRAAGDAGTPLDELLATKEARSAFAKDVGELLGGVSRNLETGFMRFGEGTIADSFSKKMGDVFSQHLGKAGAREAGEAFGEMLTRKWVRLGADHTELPELLTKALGDFGTLQPIRNLAHSMPEVVARSQHGNALARIFKQENPLQGSPMYQLGGAVASLLNEGTNEMLSEGFYNLIFGDGTFKVSGGPFASGVAMGALSAGLHRAFEPITVRYQNWVLSHQHADNPHDSRYFGLLHPINIASFVANMTGNPAPWPVPRPTSAVQDPSFARDMKDMVKWVFSNPITGTPFFADLPRRPDVTVESDGGDAFTPLDLDTGPSFADEVARDPLFGGGSDGGEGGRKEGEEASDTATKSSRTTVSADLSSLLGGGDTEPAAPVPTHPDLDAATPRPVTQSGGDRFSPSVTEETGSATRTEVRAEATTGLRLHPLQAEKDKAAAEGLDYLLPYDGTDYDEPPASTAPAGGGDGLSDDHRSDDHRSDDDRSDDGGGNQGGEGGGDGAGGDGAVPPSGAAVRDIPSGIAVGVLTPAQTTALQTIPRRPGVFVVGMHTDPRTPHDPDAVLKALTEAHDDGRLDDITEIRFTACNLASPVHESTVRTVMSGLWKHRAAKGTTTPDPLSARAADAPVWYVPTTGGDGADGGTAGGHLLTARHIGLTPDGKIAVVDEGAWHVYGDSGDPDHTPFRTTPDADALPDDAVRFLFRTPAVDAEHPDAVKFGPGERMPVDGEGELAAEIRRLAYGLELPKADAMVVFAPSSRGRDTTGQDASHDVPASELRRRATASSWVQEESATHERPLRSLRTNDAVVDLFRRLADPLRTDRAPLSLDDLTGSRIYWNASPDVPEDHNLVFHVEPPERDASARRQLGENLVVFPPGTQVRVVSFERTDTGRYLVTLRETGPGDPQQPPGGTAPHEPVVGIPGVGYPGPNRPFDSTLVHDKVKVTVRREITDEDTGGTRDVTAEVDAERYKYRKPLYIHRGEVEVEMTREGPHVRFYTAVTNQTDLTIAADGTVTSEQHKDIQQDPATGRVVLATGDTMDGTMWTGIGTPARAIAWAMKYKAETPRATEGQTPEPHKPLIRSYLVPWHIYQQITSTSVPEGDAHALGDPYRGSDSLDRRKLREPYDTTDLPEELRAREDAYARRRNAQEVGSAPRPIEAPTPLSDRTINTDQPGDRNQFGIRGEHLTLLRASVVPGSLVTYYEKESDLTPESPDPAPGLHPKNGEKVHIDVLRERLGIPGVDAPKLKESFNPWVQNQKHVNSADKLRSISTTLRQHHTTWQHSRQRPADRMPSPLLDHDTPVLPYHARLKNLEKFLKDHASELPPVVQDLIGRETLLNRPDAEDMPDEERVAKEAVDVFMRDTVLTWASHAEIGYLLSLQHQEVKADRNLTDAPLAHDFDAMRLRRKEDAHLQIQVGKDLTRLWQEGRPPHELLNRLLRDYPELSHQYAEICAPTEKYTFFQHAQMVLGQYLKLAHPDADDPHRVVPVDAIVKAILFHDIEKANSKEMYGGKRDEEEEQEQGQKPAQKKPEQHDHESEHIGAVDVMSRYRHLWGDVDQDEKDARGYWTAVRMVDSDPFGFYYRRDHSDDAGKNLDATFHWVVKLYLELQGRPLMTSDGTTRRLAELDTADTDGIRRLFHEFHQYYQADFSSYTVHSSYHDYGNPERRRAAILSGEDPNLPGPVPGSAPVRKSGRKTFDQFFHPAGDTESPDPGNPYGTGPRVTEASSVGGRPSLRFAFTDHRGYEKMYEDLAALFKDHESVVTAFGRIGGERMRDEADSLGDPANGRPRDTKRRSGRGGDTYPPADDDLFGSLWGDGGDDAPSTPADDVLFGSLWDDAGDDARSTPRDEDTDEDTGDDGDLDVEDEGPDDGDVEEDGEDVGEDAGADDGAGEGELPPTAVTLPSVDWEF
ncbi:hypothetical protein [Streptomyces sp. NPDC053431]|uniref:WXG100-like domain-containing protein n=1 Tax=Streptomyces sp. NPDC053431 TaxID=3365703 RepID=UPI0037CEF15F